jgi:hypothetical protein
VAGGRFSSVRGKTALSDSLADRSGNADILFSIRNSSEALVIQSSHDLGRAWARARPQLILAGQGCSQASPRIVSEIRVRSSFPLQPKGIDLKLARHRKKRSRAEFGPGIPREPAAARRLFAQLVRCLVG